VGIAGNFSALGYFKYFNFLAENLNFALGSLGAGTFEVWHVILPIGISFHVFQSVSYIIDIYRRDVPQAKHMIDFLAFTSLFPQLIAGPILRYKDLADQFEIRPHNWAVFCSGCLYFAIGLSKKVLIADTIAPIVTATFEMSNPTLADAWLGAVSYSAQLYFDFSGYSDMAVGLGLMMGFTFVQNFNNPYISRSITEFWRRWHISLSNWLRDYLYIPLGGNRKGKARTYINLVLTMLLGGIWHGANWTFVLWGLWHGGWMAWERSRGAKNTDTVYPGLLALPITFVLVLIGWVMFRAPTVERAVIMYKGMIGLNGIGLSSSLSWQITIFQMVTLAVAYGIVWGLPYVAKVTGRDKQGPVSPLLHWAITPLLILAVLKLSAQSYTPFLYFQF
jgi:alginate O-acetyltransferase complex protein AlgI